MRDMINYAVFGWYPYLCLIVFLLGSWVRFDREQYGCTPPRSACAPKRVRMQLHRTATAQNSRRISAR